MQTFSLSKAAELLGVSRNTLGGWLSRGCPAVSKADRVSGKEWRLSIPAIFEWRIKTAVDDARGGFHGETGQISRDEADRRKAVAQAGLAEIEHDTARRSVILVADAEANMADFAQALKEGVDNGIAKTAGRAAMMTDPNEIREFFWAEWNRSMKNAQMILDEKWAETKGERYAEPDNEFEDIDDTDD